MRSATAADHSLFALLLGLCTHDGCRTDAQCLLACATRSLEQLSQAGKRGTADSAAAIAAQEFLLGADTFAAAAGAPDPSALKSNAVRQAVRRPFHMQA